jgi:hypothetical protein
MQKAAIRICSPRKSPVARGYLWEIYLCPMLQAFFRVCRGNTIPFFVLSRKWGFCQGDEQWQNYHDCEEYGDTAFRQFIQSQAPKYQHFHFIYWNHRPMTHDKWVKILRDAGLHVTEVRNLLELVQQFQAGDHYTQIRAEPRVSGGAPGMSEMHSPV